MNNCKICGKEADKKGSHMIPHYLMKRIDSEEGSTIRGKELGFIITPKETTSYFGQSILPEKLKEVYGEITEGLIAENSVSGIQDYVFCTRCEKKLSELESEYSKTINIELLTNENSESFLNGFFSFLFWTSLIFRFSIQPDSGFKLKPKEEKKLKRILNNYFKHDLRNVEPNRKDIDLNNIGYKLLKASKFSDNNSTFLHCIPSYERPYSIMIDEYILFYYFKKSYLNGMPQDFYGSENLKNNANFNTPFSTEMTYGIDDRKLKEIIKNLINYGVRLRYKHLDSTLNKLHQKLGGKGKLMNQKLKKLILKALVENEEKDGVKDSIPNQIKIIEETIMKHTRANNGNLYTRP